MQWSPQGPPQPQWTPPPLPADDRIKKAVRRGEAFADPYEAQRAIAYAENFLRTGQSVARPPILAAIAAGLAFTVLIQLTVGMWFYLVLPVGIFIGVLVYLAWFAANRGRVEQSLAANRQVVGR